MHVMEGPYPITTKALYTEGEGIGSHDSGTYSRIEPHMVLLGRVW